MKKKTGLALLVYLAAFWPSLAQDPTSAITNWHNNKYSMFIHFGVYSELGGVWQGKAVTRGYSEQIQAHAGIMTDVYDEVPTNFNPLKWNADSIASLAKNAGMRTIVITSKHHDGFCMYHSDYTRFNVVDASPFKRDIIKELSGACQKAGLNFGLYYSLIDYRLHPFASHNANAITSDHHEYNKKQISELLTNYGPISEMWFDMGSLTISQSTEIYDLVHRLQAGCMVSGRLGNNAYDFCVMGDNEYPDYKIDAPWQTPASMFDETWGYRSWQKREDAPAKSKEKLLSLIKVVSRGGNFLLNIGPKGDGTVVPYEAEVLSGIGKWLEKYGEAIYNTSANPLSETFSWGEITSRDNNLFLILSGKKVNNLELPGITGKIRQACLMADPKTVLNTRFDKGILNIRIPEGIYSKPDIQVVKLEFNGKYLLKPELLLSDREKNLDFHNAIKHYSYSCIDYYNNHRSVVKQEWNFTGKKRFITPKIYYTAEEAGKVIELTWNGQTGIIEFTDGEKIPANATPGAIHWGKRYSYGPVDSDFESNPGKITPEMNVNLDWLNKDQVIWIAIPDFQNGKEESMISRPIQLKYILQEINADKVQNQLIEIKSGDGVQVWLNGENLVKHNNPRGSILKSEIVLLPLQTGKNQLLIKFYNRYGYEIAYSINNQISQTLYLKELPMQTISGINKCELRLHNPESVHQPIRMNNIRINIE